MSTDALLSRLERVRPMGRGRWIARCPAHEDRSPSLSVREIEGGRILLHDFGGCETADVLAAVGLRMSDLFEKPLGNFPSSSSKIPARDVLEILDHEILVACLVLADVLDARAVSSDQWSRLARCAARIGRARDACR